MPEWIAILLGLVVGLGLISGLVFLAFRQGARSRLAKPSGDWDRGTGVGGSYEVGGGGSGDGGGGDGGGGGGGDS